MTDDDFPAGTLLLVNFHHVRPGNPSRFAGLHHVTPAGLERQIESLARHFDFPDPRSLAATVDRSPHGRHCVLTFDDGLRDHYEHVAPLLESHGIRGVFSVSTAPWETGELLSVHKAHLLSAAFSYEALADELEDAARRAGVSHTLADVDAAQAQREYSYDTAEAARVKRFINAVVPQGQRDRVVGAVFTNRLGDDATHAAEHYLSPAMVRDLNRRGHAIGLHSHAHLHLASAAPAERRADLAANLRWVRAALGDADHVAEWISYPYGSPSSYDDSVIADARALGCRLGMTMSRGVNLASTGSRDVMRLARIDTNDAPGGKSPLPIDALVRSAA